MDFCFLRLERRSAFVSALAWVQSRKKKRNKKGRKKEKKMEDRSSEARLVQWESVVSRMVQLAVCPV